MGRAKKKNVLVVMARYPEPGSVLPEIAGAHGNGFAAKLYESLLKDLVGRHAGQEYDLVISFPDGQHQARFQELFPSTAYPKIFYYAESGKDAPASHALPSCYAKLFAQEYAKVIVLFNIPPFVTVQDALDAFDAIRYDHYVVVGPAGENAYLIGMKKPHAVFADSKEIVLQKITDELKKEKLTPIMLHEESVVASEESLLALAERLKRQPELLPQTAKTLRFFGLMR